MHCQHFIRALPTRISRFIIANPRRITQCKRYLISARRVSGTSSATAAVGNRTDTLGPGMTR